MGAKAYLCETCGDRAAALSLSTEAVAKFPQTWKLCVDHFRMSIGLPPRPPKKDKVPHPAYEMFNRKPPSCYGDAGNCPNKGTLYASGCWCDDHSPKNRK